MIKSEYIVNEISCNAIGRSDNFEAMYELELLQD